MLNTEIGATPASDIASLRSRAKAPAGSALPTLDDIKLERKLELAFEGHFLHDIRRWKQTISQNGTFAWNSDKLVLPIPQRELDANPAITAQQNPGY